MTKLFKLGFGFLLGLLILWEDSIFDFNCKYIWFHSLELISIVFSYSTVAHFLSCSLHQLSCCGIFICYTSYSAITHFYFIVLAIVLAKPFLLKLSYFFIITCFTLDTNQSLFCHTHMYTLWLMFRHIFYICICEYV